MKKIFSLIAALALCFTTAVPTAAAKASPFERLNRYANAVEPWNTPVSVLNANVSFQSVFTMESDDFLVIPAGKTLRLKGGAEIGGKIYVENGGRLIFEGGRAFARGTIVSDGTVVVYTGGENAYRGGAAVFVSGTLYVSEQARLTERKSDGTGIEVEFSDRVTRGDSGAVVCLGKTNCKYGDIGRNPVTAIVTRRAPYTVNFTESEQITDSVETLYPAAEKYFRDADIPYGGGERYLSILFDNGVCLYACLQISAADGEMKYVMVCGLDVHLAMEALVLARA